MTTGDRIKQLRIEKGWTQEELARRCGYSGKSVISKTESSADDIGTKKVQRIAAALGVSPADLVDWEAQETFDNDSDKTALREFVLAADPEAIHQLRVYADFLKDKGVMI